MCCFIRKNILFYFLIYWINFNQVVVISKEAFEFSQPSKCKNSEYFDTVSLSCIECNANKNLKPSDDRLRCICNEFSKKIGFKDGYPICVFCGINATVTLDGNDCVPCNNTICKCASNEIQIDRSLNGTLLNAMYCLPCPNNTYPFLDRSKCLPCKNFKYNYYENDTYLRKYYYTQAQNYCLQKSTFFDKQNSKTQFQIKFESQNIDSYYFRSELQIATYFCKRKDKLACEHLSNMCALSLYTNDIACKFFMQEENSPIWIFYDKNETMNVLNYKLTQNYSLMKGNNDSVLNFTVVTFSLHGNLKSIGTPNIPCNLLKYVRFGINFEKKCKLPVKNLMEAKVEIMSPYLTFMRNNISIMYALPILIKNINQNHDKISDWRLVRKFFFVDNISGVKTLSNVTSSKIEKANELSVLRYIKSLNIIINVQNIKNKNQIFLPILNIEYDELTHEQIDKITEVTLDYKIKFTVKDNNNSHLMILTGTFSVLVLILSGTKTWSYSKRHHTSLLNVSVLVWFFIYTLSSIGSVIILYIIILCLYLFMFYKGETIPYILFPEDVSEKTIKIFTTVALFSKFVEVLGFIFQYRNIDIFFIDWEQPKTIYNQCKHDPPYMSINDVYIDKLSKSKYKHFQLSSETITARRKKLLDKLNKHNSKYFDKSFSTDKHRPNVSTVNSISKISNQIMDRSSNFSNSPISIWRTCYIANQWLTLQTKRKINIMVQLLTVLCIFQIIQLCPWILAIPELTSKLTKDNYNFILYYTVCILIYVLIYCIQWLISIIFYERCITNRMQEFINLCSITNISIFILPFNYYGFYIHGRSVHGFADIDLPTLINDLQMEKNNLCAHRGLEPGTTQQTFTLYLTKTFRTIFNKNLKMADIEQNNFVKSYYSSDINWEHIFSTQLKIKQFLSKFIDHCIKYEDYTIKEQPFFEKLCNTVSSHNEEKSSFYIDNNYSFNQVLLYGNEWLFATFEISVFTFIIVLCEDCILAIIITVIVSMLLTAIIKYNGKRNLNKYTLLDKIFLI